MMVNLIIKYSDLDVTNNTEDSSGTSSMSANKDVVEEPTQDSNSMPENEQNLEQENVEVESEPLKEDDSNLNEVSRILVFC